VQSRPRSKLDWMTVPAIILAAGASRRLGQPKQLVPIAGEALLARTVRIVHESGSDPILVVLGAHRETITAGIDLSQTHPVVNPNWEQGIATSIQAAIDGLLRLKPEANAAMFLVCDQPKLALQHLCLLTEAHERAVEATIVASRYAGVAGIPAICKPVCKPAGSARRYRSERSSAQSGMPDDHGAIRRRRDRYRHAIRLSLTRVSSYSREVIIIMNL
jgi:molybdenum cofactor cytidylyltransferase